MEENDLIPQAAPTSDTFPDAAPAHDLQQDYDALWQEVQTLRQEKAESLAQAKRQQEWEELHALFPEADPQSLPKEVTEQDTLPLAAAYALYCRRQELLLQSAAGANAQNARHSAGAISAEPGEGQDFTVEEIKKMSGEAVRRNYTSILESLKKHKTRKDR